MFCILLPRGPLEPMEKCENIVPGAFEQKAQADHPRLVGPLLIEIRASIFCSS